VGEGVGVGEAPGDGEVLAVGCGAGVAGWVEPSVPIGGRFSGGGSSPVGRLPQPGTSKIADAESARRRRILGDRGYHARL